MTALTYVTIFIHISIKYTSYTMVILDSKIVLKRAIKSTLMEQLCASLKDFCIESESVRHSGHKIFEIILPYALGPRYS